MSKIVQAINAMISNPRFISNVIRADKEEIYFLYKGKYKWSIAHRDEGYYLFYYPGDDSIQNLADEPWNPQIPIVVYKDTDIGTKEAKASFAELYTVVVEKVFGVDAVLDDIIGDDF